MFKPWLIDVKVPKVCQETVLPSLSLHHQQPGGHKAGCVDGFMLLNHPEASHQDTFFPVFNLFSFAKYVPSAASDFLDEKSGAQHGTRLYGPIGLEVQNPSGSAVSLKPACLTPTLTPRSKSLKSPLFLVLMFDVNIDWSSWPESIIHCTIVTRLANWMISCSWGVQVFLLSAWFVYRIMFCLKPHQQCDKAISFSDFLS